MLQSAARTTNVAIAESGPTGFIQPAIPYAFAFALGSAPVLHTRMPLGRIVTVAVADGTPAPRAPHDLFAGRVPAIPAATGPVHVAGVRRGDVFEIEVISIETNGSAASSPLLVTIAIAGAGRGATLNQSAIPGGIVRATARQPGGLVTFGPVVAWGSCNGDPPGEPVAARMMVRCTVVQTQGV